MKALILASIIFATLSLPQVQASDQEPTFSEIADTVQLLLTAERTVAEAVQGKDNVILVMGSGDDGREPLIDYLQSLGHHDNEMSKPQYISSHTLVVSFTSVQFDSTGSGQGLASLASLDVANSWFLQKLVDSTKYLKILLTVPYTDVMASSLWNFVSLLQLSTQLLPRFDGSHPSLGLVVTGVGGDEDLSKVSSEIESFLRQTRIYGSIPETKPSCKEEELRMLRIVDALLSQSSAGSYTNVAVLQQINGTNRNEGALEALANVTLRNTKFVRLVPNEITIKIRAPAKETAANVSKFFADNLEISALSFRNQINASFHDPEFNASSSAHLLEEYEFFTTLNFSDKFIPSRTSSPSISQRQFEQLQFLQKSLNNTGLETFRQLVNEIQSLDRTPTRIQSALNGGAGNQETGFEIRGKLKQFLQNSEDIFIRNDTTIKNVRSFFISLEDALSPILITEQSNQFFQVLNCASRIASFNSQYSEHLHHLSWLEPWGYLSRLEQGNHVLKQIPDERSARELETLKSTLLTSPLRASIFGRRNFSGYREDYEDTSSSYEGGCHRIKYEGAIESALPYNSCVRLFQQHLCTGYSLAIYPSSQTSHYSHLLNFSRIKSIGPCLTQEFAHVSAVTPSEIQANKHLLLQKDLDDPRAIPDLVETAFDTNSFEQAFRVQENIPPHLNYRLDPQARLKYIKSSIHRRSLRKPPSGDDLTPWFRTSQNGTQLLWSYAIPWTLGGYSSGVNVLPLYLRCILEWKEQTDSIYTYLKASPLNWVTLRLNFLYQGQEETRPRGFFYSLNFNDRRVKYDFIYND